jgi:hypothetical protein
MATRSEIDAVFGVLRRAYAYTASRQDDDEMAQTIRLYEECLADIDVETLQAAAVRCIQQSKWFPTIAELRAAAEQINPAFRWAAEAARLEAYYAGLARRLESDPAEQARRKLLQ